MDYFTAGCFTMIRIEQFVYTTTALDTSSGYRVVAKSPGINAKFVSELEPYMLPAGIDARNFKQSKSLYIIGDGTHVAYSLARNIGRGPDGRPDAMLNHTLVIDMKSFKSLSYDTRDLDSFFSHTVPSVPLLPSLTTAPKVTAPVDSDYIRSQTPLLTRTLYALIRGDSIGVRRASDERFAQATLALLPPRLRLVPFSTCAVDLRAQPAYRLVLLGDSMVAGLPKHFKTIDNRPYVPFTDVDLGRTARYMVAMASVDGSHLTALHVEFEKINPLSPRKCLDALTAVLRMAQSPDPLHSGRDLQIVVDFLGGLTPVTWRGVLARLGHHMHPGDRSKLVDMIEAKCVRYNVSDCMPTKTSIEISLRQVDERERYKLLHTLYKSNKIDVDNDIDQLFEDFAYSYYGKDFFNFVSSVPDLRQRMKKFAGMSSRNSIRRQASVRLFVLASLESGSPSSIEPAIFKPYDLSNGYDLDSFESLLLEIFSSSTMEQDSSSCAPVAVAGLSYMAGFNRSYLDPRSQPSRYHTKRFSALADRLGKLALFKDGPFCGKDSSLKDNRKITQLLRKCGITTYGTGG